MKKKQKTQRRRPEKKQRVVSVHSKRNQPYKMKRSLFMTFVLVILFIVITIAIITQLKHIYIHLSGKGH
ncbi:hypothetical protein A9970_01980 [Sphingobacterium sp. UME9]|nr:hypothetical protein [Sphingobacterium sp. UME9]